MAKWITDPPGRKPGSLMPNLGLTKDQVNVLVTYLQSLK
jgi:cytochrome c1